MITQRLLTQINQLNASFTEKREKLSHQISAQSDTVRIEAQLADVDRLGYQLTALEAQSLDAGATVNQTRVTDQIETLLRRVTYLTETLTLVEKSDNPGRVLIRSANPDRRTDGISYYQIEMENGTKIRLDRRYYDFGTRRRLTVPFTLSPEVFQRLVGDLEEALTDNTDASTIQLPPRFDAVPSVWEAGF